MDLREQTRSPRVGCRRLYALIVNLPPTAAYPREDDPWTDAEHLLATIGDLIAVAHGIRAGGKPFTIPRPGAENSDGAPSAVETMRDLMKGE